MPRKTISNKELMQIGYEPAVNDLKFYFDMFSKYYEEDVEMSDRWSKWAMTRPNDIVQMLTPYVDKVYGDGLLPQGKVLGYHAAVKEHNRIAIITLGDYEKAKFLWYQHIASMHPCKKYFSAQWIKDYMGLD